MPRIIAIGGVSRSGKSTLALWLHQQLPNSIVLCQDDFPNEEEAIPRIRDRVDWERPESIRWDYWHRAIGSMKDDCDYLILEGLFIFRPEGGIVPDHSIYLSIDREDFLKARKAETRWGPEPDWFIEHVWDSHFVYGLPPEGAEVMKIDSVSEADYPSILSQVKG